MPSINDLKGKTIKEAEMKTMQGTHQVMVLRFTDGTVLTIEAVEGVVSLFQNRKRGEPNESKKRVCKQ